jgi:hypothetical protein
MKISLSCTQIGLNKIKNDEILQNRFSFYLINFWICLQRQIWSVELHRFGGFHHLQICSGKQRSGDKYKTPGWEFTKLLAQIRNIFCNFGP